MRFLLAPRQRRETESPGSGDCESCMCLPEGVIDLLPYTHYSTSLFVPSASLRPFHNFSRSNHCLLLSLSLSAGKGLTRSGILRPSLVVYRLQPADVFTRHQVGEKTKDIRQYLRRARSRNAIRPFLRYRFSPRRGFFRAAAIKATGRARRIKHKPHNPSITSDWATR